jgi:hypothetical protein
MAATALAPPRFVRRTRLGANEYRRNFHQIDHDVLAAVTSAEADRVTPLMSKIYLRLVSSPTEFWEREGVLYFSAGEEDGRAVKASKVLYRVLGVASATAHKALGWMHEQGIIGYFAGKNGAGIRIFLNRAVGSIGMRTAAAGKKILPFVRGSNEVSHGSADEPAFNDSYAVSEVLETDLNPRAPESGAEKTEVVKKHQAPQVEVSLGEIVSRLKGELMPSLQSAAREAAMREHERTREWLESRGLPKAARVAQRETYNVLRQHGLVGAAAGARAGAEVGRRESVQAAPRRLSEEEITELAETCLAMLEVHGRAIDVSLAELSTEAGGILLPEDAPKVLELAEAMVAGMRGHRREV